jgi:hypothetical protein
MESQSSKKIVVSLVILLMIIPLNVVHEVGHGFICALYGNGYSITLSLFGRSNTTCPNNNFNQIVYGMAGGIFVVILSLLFLVIPQIRKNTGTRIGFSALAVMALGNAVLEGFLFEFYNQNILLSEFILYTIWFISIAMQWMIIVRQN